MAEEQQQNKKSLSQVQLDAEQFKQEVANEISADLKRLRAGKGAKKGE